MAAKHTPGPWVRDARSGLECDVRASSGRKVALCWGLASNNATNYRVDYRAECDANAHLIAAAPELLAIAQNFEITGPDDDGLMWLVLHGNGTTGRAMFNLGSKDQLAGKVAAALEEDRLSAIAKATGDQR